MMVVLDISILFYVSQYFTETLWKQLLAVMEELLVFWSYIKYISFGNVPSNDSDTGHKYLILRWSIIYRNFMRTTIGYYGRIISILVIYWIYQVLAMC